VHVRRALLLFAIVLMLAALATSVSRPQRERADAPASPTVTEGPGEPTTEPGPAATELRVPGGGGRRRARLEVGQAATLVVAVEEDGEVGLPALGLTQPATPLAPARFELLGEMAGDYAIDFTPAAGGESRRVGRLLVAPDS
jgi:hypothetical protein